MTLKRAIIYTCAIILCFSFIGKGKFEKSSINKVSDAPLNIIMDTDIGSSTDDLFSLQTAYILHKAKKINLKAVIISRMGLQSAKMQDIMNTYYGLPIVPIGIVKNGISNPPCFINYWQMTEPEKHNLNANFKRTYSDEQLLQLPSGVELYRRCLSEAQDSSITIICTGFITVLAQLLKSMPDENSPLTGLELVKRKVKNIYIQAGSVTGTNPEPEFNLSQDPDNSFYFVNNWPTEIIYSPVESGQSFDYSIPMVLADLSGAGLEDSPIYFTYKYFNCDTGQRMWDLITFLMAIHPEHYRKIGSLHITVDQKMIIHSQKVKGGKHSMMFALNKKRHQALMKLIRQYATTK